MEDEWWKEYDINDEYLRRFYHDVIDDKNAHTLYSTTAATNRESNTGCWEYEIASTCKECRTGLFSGYVLGLIRRMLGIIQIHREPCTL